MAVAKPEIEIVYKFYLFLYDQLLMSSEFQ